MVGSSVEERVVGDLKVKSATGGEHSVRRFAPEGCAIKVRGADSGRGDIDLVYEASRRLSSRLGFLCIAGEELRARFSSSASSSLSVV